MTQQLSFDDIETKANEDPSKIAVTYARSDKPEEIQAQLQRGVNYSRDELDYDISEITINTPNDTHQSGTGSQSDTTGHAAAFVYDTDDTHPQELEHLADAARERAVEDVIVEHLATLSHSIEDTSETVEIINDAGATIHALDDNLNIPPGPGGGDARAALRAAARTNTDVRPRVTGETHSGRPPAGFEVVNGRLRKADDYDELRNALINVIENGLSHADAVRATNYSRSTIINCKRQRDRYNLPGNE